MRVRRVIGMAVFALACPPAVASDAFLVPLGRPAGVERAPIGGTLSGDGRVFYTNFRGLDTNLAYVWTPKGGFEPVALPANPGLRGAGVWASSRDGSVAGGSVHFSLSPLGTVGAVWVNGPRKAPQFGIWASSVMMAVSADGSSWGGDSTVGTTGMYRNGVWVEVSPGVGEVHGLSENGRVAVGWAATLPGQPIIGNAFVWSEATGLRRLPRLPGFTYDNARRVTLDGALVAGISILEGGANGLWLWDEGRGFTMLGAPHPGASGYQPYLSGDGRTYGAHFNDPASGARHVWLRFLDDPASGWVRFDDHLARFGVSTAG